MANARWVDLSGDIPLDDLNLLWAGPAESKLRARIAFIRSMSRSCALSKPINERIRAIVNPKPPEPVKVPFERNPDRIRASIEQHHATLKMRPQDWDVQASLQRLEGLLRNLGEPVPARAAFAGARR